ncbi:MAG: DUF732 domain-containing protein [Mycobacterium sp.]
MNSTEAPGPGVVVDWVAREAPHHAKSRIRALLFAVAGGLAAGFVVAAPAQPASVATNIDICAALRNGTSLATIEATLEARGFSPSKAGAVTGSAIREHCPDQAANARAQMQRAAA